MATRTELCESILEQGESLSSVVGFLIYRSEDSGEITLEVDSVGPCEYERVSVLAVSVYGEHVRLGAVRMHPNREVFLATKQRRGFMQVLRDGEEAGVDAFIEADYKPKDRDPEKVSGPHPSRVGERQFGDAALQQYNK